MRDKRAKFKNLAESRVNRAIKDLRLIGNLSNKSAYAFEDDDIRKIFRVLHKELEDAKGRFGGARDAKEEDFRL